MFVLLGVHCIWITLLLEGIHYLITFDKLVKIAYVLRNIVLLRDKSMHVLMLIISGAHDCGKHITRQHTIVMSVNVVMIVAKKK